MRLYARAARWPSGPGERAAGGRGERQWALLGAVWGLVAVLWGLLIVILLTIYAARSPDARALPDDRTVDSRRR